MVTAFARLKLVLLRNSLRRSPGQVVLTLLSIPLAFAACAAGLVAGALLRVIEPAEAARAVPVIATGVFLCWLISPVMTFASDNTLDPARLVLLPLRARELMAGMAVAAWIGIPPLATLGALSLAAAGTGRTPVGLVAALAGAVLTAALSVYASRALAAALAGILRSRRGRDLGNVLMVLLAGSGGVIAIGLPAALAQKGVYNAVSAVARWTPPGLAYSAGSDASAGHWGRLAADLGVPAVTLALVVAWWGRTLAAALVSPGSASSGARGGAVRSLFPRGPGRWIPRSRGGAVYARELRYSWRSPYRRSMVAMALVMGSFFALSSSVFTGHGSGSGLFAGCYAAGLFALGAGNALGYEGRSLWLHHTVPGPAAADWAGRIAAPVTVGMVPVVLATALSCAFGSGWGYLPAALALGLVVLATMASLAAVLSVVFPYPMPDVDSSPFSTSLGGGMRSMISVAVLLGGTAVLTSPVLALAAAGRAGWAPGLPLAVVAAPVWAFLAAAAGSRAAGAVHDRRAPEVFAIVSPRS
ncbi:MAG: type transport system permease protein [Cryptosporangiaceae bacterium]|nr:type transport system permease protein [Cryptosporangiaceae bacterium]